METTCFEALILLRVGLRGGACKKSERIWQGSIRPEARTYTNGAVLAPRQLGADFYKMFISGTEVTTHDEAMN